MQIAENSNSNEALKNLLGQGNEQNLYGNKYGDADWTRKPFPETLWMNKENIEQNAGGNQDAPYCYLWL